MPSIHEIKTIIADSSQQDWKFFDGPSQKFVFKPDPNIRIEQEDEFSDGYVHTWTAIFPDSDNDSTARFQVYYNSSPIDSFAVLFTDGGRIQVPTPRVQNADQPDELDEYEFAFSQYQATIGRVMSGADFDSWFPSERVDVLTDLFH